MSILASCDSTRAVASGYDPRASFPIKSISLSFGEESKEEIQGDDSCELDDDFSYDGGASTLPTVPSTLPTVRENEGGAADDAHADQASPPRRGRRRRRKRREKKKGKEKREGLRSPLQRSKKQSPSRAAKSEAKTLRDKGTWMCGICGSIFDTEDNATAHEDQCILEFLKHDRRVREKWRADDRRLDADSGVPCINVEDSPFIREYPAFYPPITGGEIYFKSELTKKFLVMSDDALIRITDRASRIFNEECVKDIERLELKEVKSLETLPSERTRAIFSKKDEEVYDALITHAQEQVALDELMKASADRHAEAEITRREIEDKFGVNPDWDHFDYYYHHQNKILASRAGTGDADEGDECPWPREVDDKEERSVKSRLVGPIQGRFKHAYQLVKQGPKTCDKGRDQYKRPNSRNDRDASGEREIQHDKNTLYVNVVVKNSVQVVQFELHRIARGWWAQELEKKKADGEDMEKVDFQFEWLRKLTQRRVIELAGLALASDFTPSKIAIQLSNDLYRLMGPSLLSRGVKIQTDIEYREGAYFVLAVNILSIDWKLLLTWVAEEQRELKKSRVVDGKTTSKKKTRSLTEIVQSFTYFFPTFNELLAYLLTCMHQLPSIVSVPVLRLAYALFLRYSIDHLILNATSNDIFRYVESKGMEMELGVHSNKTQAQMMLAALHEIRHGAKRKSSDEGDETDSKPVLGPLLGPAVKEDNSPVTLPADFIVPVDLEFIGLETDLPGVGFKRIRWAILHSESSFLEKAFFAPIMSYDKISMEQWKKKEDDIEGVGATKPPDGVDESSFVGARREFSYLMPKSAFVKANMCYATFEISRYDEHCLVIKEKTLTPDVPYGNTFISWTQYSIVNNGRNSCRLVCSVEAEFPQGPPMVARQIKSGMRTGTAEKFVALGEAICRYAEAFPK
mmetsp:Transcript_37812/g.85087  ORF Transcript_37812/g.85087 Transcript_37812/m.85087 type:complete len:915 (+) Transcript_37812:113-2857(+)